MSRTCWAVLLAVTLTVNLSAETVRVGPGQTYQTIQAGIDAIAAGTVLVTPGVYVEQINLDGKPITVRGEGGAAILDGNAAVAVSCINGEGPDTVLEHLVIRNAFAAVYCNGTEPTLRNLTVVHNDRGVLALAAADPHIRNSIFWANAEDGLVGLDVTYTLTHDGAAGAGNFTADPLFVDPFHDNYRLQSRFGHAAEYPGWTGPMAVPELNLPNQRANSPHLSPDSLTIYFARLESAGAPHEVIVEAQRAHPDDPFTEVREYRELFHGLTTGGPWVTADGLRMYYHEGTEYNGSWQDAVLQLAERPDTDAPWVWQRTLTETDLDMGLQVQPSVTSDELEIFWQQQVGSGQSRIYTATRNHAHEPFNNPHPAAGLDSIDFYTMESPYLMPDGLVMYFHGHYGSIYQNWNYDIYRVSRPHRAAPWGNLELAEQINTESTKDANPCVSPDETTFYFTRDVWQTSPAGIYTARRQPPWLLDAVTSPAIDAADPADAPLFEAEPNGGRRNAGAYGGTAQASLSPHPWPNPADFNHDGVVDLVDFAAFSSSWAWQAAWY